MSHQVFIERCRDSRPETGKALARALASRYGVDPAQIEGRLQKGRFQVKANLDLPAARAFVSYLEGEGALCSVVNASGQTVMRSAAIAKPSMPARDSVSMPDPDEHDEFALHTPPPPPDYSNEYESGLSAGFAGAGSSQALGALDDDSATASASYQLSTLDGRSEQAPSAPRQSATAAHDDHAAFLPPDMLREKELVLDVERPELAEIEAPPPAPVLAAELATELVEAEATPGAPMPDRVLGALSRKEPLRFAVGVGLAIVVAFVAVHFFAAGREADRYGSVIEELRAEYKAADSVAAWQGLDQARAQALDTLAARRSTIVIMSLVIWLALGALLLFAWLRLIDWTRWEGRGLAPSASRTSAR